MLVEPWMRSVEEVIVKWSRSSSLYLFDLLKEMSSSLKLLDFDGKLHSNNVFEISSSDLQ